MTPTATQPDITDAVQRHQASLLRYACSLCHDEELARDAVQDTFIRLVRQNETDPPGQLHAWLFKVCRNRVFEILRKRRPMVGTDPADLLIESPDPSPSQKLADAERTASLRHLLTTLPPREQELLRLKFQNELSYKEIAEVTGLTVSNVGFILHHAVQTLRQKAAASAS